MPYRIETVETDTEKKLLNTIALRGIIIFPGTVASFEIARKSSVNAMKQCELDGTSVFLVAQYDASLIEPGENDLMKVGVIARIIHSAKVKDGGYQIVVEGITRADRGTTVITEDSILCAVSERRLRRMPTYTQERIASKRLYDVFSDYLQYVSKPSEEIIAEARKIRDTSALADFLANNFLVNFGERREILEEYDPVKRINRLCEIFQKDIEIINLEGNIQQKVRYNLSKQQREIYLREQMRAIRSELGDEGADDDMEDADEYYRAIEEAKLPKDVHDKLCAENAKLSKMPFGTPEATVIRNYIETCLELPWNKKSKDRVDIAAAKKILNKDHDGIEKVKERILEFMAVKQLNPELKGQILCFVGPPGVGKTSVAKSIAAATNRKFVRISLGGIRDEAEIRGHRRTYIGSMPGRVINALKLAGTRNPVMLFDELDKLANDMHGDPTSAMLEVLDPEQNNAFRDNFIEIPFDLSECLFIATANTTETIPPALLDRLEVIYMDSYSDSEKLAIAKHHLIPKQLNKHGLKASQCRITDEAVKKIIVSYTRENGVRNLEREIASVCRKSARRIVEGEKKIYVGAEEITRMLGPEKFIPDKIYDADEVGVVNGLAWTYLGGEMLRIEVSSMKGSGKLELTGHLGDVMKESARAAVSYIRKHCDELNIPENFYNTYDIHIHVPEGAIPKDGPSAGITICTALVSELTGRSVKRDVCMTGELTLTGRVLPIGGLKEKAMAAYKTGAKTVIIPFENEHDISEFEDEVKNALTFIPVKHISEVLKIALN
ncbi:MAG: endopeptidase La [Clostridia bacterium]|nr:endopeptidase La [Clostridia bacterium]